MGARAPVRIVSNGPMGVCAGLQLQTSEEVLSFRRSCNWRREREREREKGVETATSFRSSGAEINTTFVFIFVSVNTMDVFASGGRERSLPK